MGFQNLEANLNLVYYQRYSRCMFPDIPLGYRLVKYQNYIQLDSGLVKYQKYIHPTRLSSREISEIYPTKYTVEYYLKYKVCFLMQLIQS